MKSSIAYTQTLNIMIVFITVIFAFILAILTYYKAYKVSNILSDDVEKYEGYNALAEEAILRDMKSLGYTSGNINCAETIDGTCKLVSSTNAQGSKGYCAYRCPDTTDFCYYYYKITTGMFVNIPIINNVVTMKVGSETDRMFDFETCMRTKSAPTADNVKSGTVNTEQCKGNYKTLVNNYNNSIMRLKDEIAVLGKEITSLKKAYITIESRCTTLEQNVTTLSQELNSLSGSTDTTKYNTVMTELRQKESELGSARKELEDNDETQDKKQSQIDEKNNMINNYQDKITEYVAKYCK